ncbi:hypothetical protein, conserved [Eimeria brunetti]|uniref:Uncharacterized protein n=1 Tax=Eimeria brunetti TaxID=51314 RepID=U6M0B3_9EIME|nr:hypothetical protein, conserved [Eimeria brunetti]
MGNEGLVSPSLPLCCNWYVEVYVHLGKRSVCCCSSNGGSFASQFIAKNLGPAADSLTASAAAAAASAAASAAAAAAGKKSSKEEPRKFQIQDVVRQFAALFVSHDGLLFKACKEGKEDIRQGCSVCCLSLLPRAILAAFVGGTEAVVFLAEPAAAAAADAAAAAATTAAAAAANSEADDEAAGACITAWPLGAPEAFRRQVEQSLKGGKKDGEKVDKNSAKDSNFLASSLPEAKGLLTLQEDASEFLLRKAVVQTVLKREKTVQELLYHPAALRAAGLPHWKDDRLEMEQRAALGNTRTEKMLMRRVAATQEEYINKSAIARSLSKPPFVDSDIGVLVLLFNHSPNADESELLLRDGEETTAKVLP